MNKRIRQSAILSVRNINNHTHILTHIYTHTQSLSWIQTIIQMYYLKIKTIATKYYCDG